MKSYKVLNNKEEFRNGEFSLVPIRYEDRHLIMNWRNEQIYHLRQNKILSSEDQDSYFIHIIENLFEQDNPSQLLFSFLENGNCIGYGGLVHINWIDKHAEISFIMDTKLETDFFKILWIKYLSLIERIAFNELLLHKIFTYAFDLRPLLYHALEEFAYQREATLPEHCYFNGSFKDVVIHSKINKISLREVKESDLEITFNWASNKKIRHFSFNKSAISYEEHKNWFYKKIISDHCLYLILENLNGKALGSVRIDIENKEGIISYLIDDYYHGKGLGFQILNLLEQFIKQHKVPVDKLIGFVQNNNIASIRIFEKLQYEKIKDNDSLKFQKQLK